MDQKRRSSFIATPSSDNSTESSPLLPCRSNTSRSTRPWIGSSSSISSIILLVVVLISFAGRSYLNILYIYLPQLIRIPDQVAESPETRLLESVICYRYYEQSDPSRITLGRDAVGPGAIGGVDKASCKVAPVQHQLAEFNGYRVFLDGIPALLLAIPFGWAADKPRFGRWPIVFLNLLHMTLRAGWVQVRKLFDIKRHYR